MKIYRNEIPKISIGDSYLSIEVINQWSLESELIFRCYKDELEYKLVEHTKLDENSYSTQTLKIYQVFYDVKEYLKVCGFKFKDILIPEDINTDQDFREYIKTVTS